MLCWNFWQTKDFSRHQIIFFFLAPKFWLYYDLIDQPSSNLESLVAVSECVASLWVDPGGGSGSAITNRSKLAQIAELAVDLIVITYKYLEWKKRQEWSFHLKCLSYTFYCLDKWILKCTKYMIFWICLIRLYRDYAFVRS